MSISQMTAMIHAGDISPDVTLLINDSGRYVLHAGDQSIEVDGSALAEAIERTKGIAALVERSQTPISGMSGPVERMLDRFGCAVYPPEVG